MNKNLVAAIFLFVLGFYLWVDKPIEAQDTAPTWEYAILVYGNNDASVFTGNDETAGALTALLVPQDSNAANIALALNVMGADGWELVDMIPGGSTIYMFKKPG